MSELSHLVYSVLKLSNLFISIFYNISVNGFCQPPNMKQDGSGEQSSGVHEGGFGMSDAQGVEDISKEIEDEEQLLGLKEDRKEDMDTTDNKPDSKKDKNSGFEMQTDFKEDFKEELSENSDNDDEEEKQNEEKEEDIDREKDNVDDAKDNKMYDKDNEIEDEE